jgi:hypothetical protein
MFSKGNGFHSLLRTSVYAGQRAAMQFLSLSKEKHGRLLCASSPAAGGGDLAHAVELPGNHDREAP